MSKANVKVGHVTKRGSKVDAVRMAGEDHAVITLTGKGDAGYMKKPCAKCPWRVDATGEFPAEAFKHSAATSYDASMNVFACHDSGIEVGKTCAGFLLRNADNNITVRLKRMSGKIVNDISDGGHELHADYKAMAIANGVDPNDPVLRLCRGND